MVEVPASTTPVTPGHARLEERFDIELKFRNSTAKICDSRAAFLTRLNCHDKPRAKRTGKPVIEIFMAALIFVGLIFCLTFATSSTIFNYRFRSPSIL